MFNVWLLTRITAFVVHMIAGAPMRMQHVLRQVMMKSWRVLVLASPAAPWLRCGDLTIALASSKSSFLTLNHSEGKCGQSCPCCLHWNKPFHFWTGLQQFVGIFENQAGLEKTSFSGLKPQSGHNQSFLHLLQEQGNCNADLFLTDCV